MQMRKGKGFWINLVTHEWFFVGHVTPKVIDELDRRNEILRKRRELKKALEAERLKKLREE